VRGGHADSARSHATSCCCLFDTSPDCPEAAMWRTRLSVALHRALAESYVRRAEMLRAAVALQQGVMPLAVVDVLQGEEGVVGWG
jgi:hypothetical protein